MTKEKKRTSHHHGDLRAALVAAALTHVRKDGASTFSLRHATAGAGVSSGAAYRHFQSRNDVLNEVVVHGFELLSRFMQTQSAGATGADLLEKVGLSYIAFARDEPHLFSLMFGIEGAAGRERSYQTDFGVLNASDQLGDALRKLGVDHATDFQQAWAVAHGLATLSISGLAGSTEDQAATIKMFVRQLLKSKADNGS